MTRLIYECRNYLCLHTFPVTDDESQFAMVKCGLCGSDVEIHEITDGLTGRLMEVWNIHRNRPNFPARLEDYG